ncbi:MAG: gliding motility protein GldC [Saprospiraceae bacterium]
MKKETISITIELDDSKVPSRLTWDSSDNPKGKKNEEAKAFLLSIFSKEKLETLKIDLWTKEMQVSEMDRLFYNTLKGLAETYKKATHNNDLASDMDRFAQYFGEEVDILPRSP